MRRLKRVLGGVLSLAVGLVGFALAQGFGEAAGEIVERYLYEPDRQEKLEAAAEGVRERLDLPKQLDRITTLRDVESGQNRLIYFYKIDPGPGRTLVDDWSQMQGRALRRRLCEGDKKAYEAWRSLLRDGVAIEARYRFASDRDRESFLLEPGVCGIGKS